MKETLDLANGRLLLNFPDREELDGYLERSRGYGFTVRLDERLEPDTEIEVVLSSTGPARSFPTRVKQVFRSGRDRFGTIFEVLDWGAAASDDGGNAVAAGSESRAGATEAPAERVPEVQAALDEKSGTSIVFDIRKLNPSERIRLASKANRNERQVLLRDPAPPVAMALLSNPRIEPKEALEIVKNPQAASGVLQRVAQDRRFAGNYEIQLALVKNPKTPSPIAIRFVDVLRTNDLREMAKSQALRENVRKAALRTYLKRSSDR